MLYGCYLKNGVVYMPTVGMRGGAYSDIEPVEVVPVADSAGLRRAFLDVMARKNAAVPLIKGKWPPPVVLKYAGVKTWSAFAKDALTWKIQDNDGVYQIAGYQERPDGYWVEDQDQKTEFPPGTTVDTVIDRMIAILQDTALK